MIVGAAGQMQTLINSLLNFAQVAQGELNREMVHVADLIDTLRISMHSLIEESGAVISVREVPDVLADPCLLGRVFQNLIANSIQYRDKTFNRPSTLWARSLMGAGCSASRTTVRVFRQTHWSESSSHFTGCMDKTFREAASAWHCAGRS